MQRRVISIVSGLFIILVGSIICIKIIRNNKTEISNSSENSITMENNSSDLEDDNNDAQDNYVNEEIESISVKDMKSLNDITDEMIRLRTVGYNTVAFSSNYTNNDFKISFGTFSGCDYSKIIHTEKETEVTIHFTTTVKSESLKIALIVEDKVITIPIEENEFTYTLPKGDTIIALTGYKASGKIEMSLDSIDGVKFMQNTEFQ